MKYELILLQQFVRLLNLSVPLLVAYFIAPKFVLSYQGIVVCSIAVGIFATWSTYFASKRQLLSWQFEPSAAQKNQFNAIITACELDPAQITLRYDNTNDAVTMVLFNTIVVDPTLWKNIEDEEFIKVRNIIVQHILPAADEHKKKLHTQVAAIVTPDVQEFMFKHALGRAAYKFSIKLIALTGIITTYVASAGMLGVRNMLAMGMNGFAAFVVGLLGAFLMDMILNFGANVLFKAQSEKDADLFACEFSSRQQIENAADFFEKNGHYTQEYRNSFGGLYNILPTIFLGGADGTTRARYLRRVAAQKE